MPAKTTITQDCRTGTRKIEVFNDPGNAAATADKIRDILASSDAMVKVRDERTGDFIIFNSMKTVDIRVEKIEEIPGVTIEE